MFRELQVNDLPILLKLLVKEGYNITDSGIAEGDTWILEENKIIKGFFTSLIIHNLPYLLHFVVKREYRQDRSLMYKLIRKFRSLAKERGYTQCLYHAPKNKPHVAHVLAFYLKQIPYGEDSKNYYFISGV